jgi:cytidylate kinase
VSRSIEALVEEQVRRWRLARTQEVAVVTRPVVTVTGQHGARGDDLSRQLAANLGFDLFDREIIHLVAESAHLSDQVVATLDGKKREMLAEWLAGFASRNYLSSAEYRYHLAHVIGAIAQQGGAVILGRGAHLLLEGRALSVLAIAPLEDRVRAVAAREGMTERAARRRIAEVDSDRRAFILMHYHEEFADPSVFDMVVNTAKLGLDASVAAIRAALEAREAEKAAKSRKGGGRKAASQNRSVAAGTGPEGRRA